MEMSFQGYPCTDVSASRTRGSKSDVYTVEIPVVLNWPDGVAVHAPKAGEPLFAKPQGAQSETEGESFPTEIRYSGTLVLGDEVTGHRMVIEPLFVLEVEETRREAEDIPATERKSTLKLVLGDSRLFYGLGVMQDGESTEWAPRWSFNRADRLGRLELDSVKVGGEAWTLREVLARFVGPSLPAAPKLARLPNRQDFDRAADVEYVPFESPALALQRVVDEYKLADPCLNWSGSLALYDDGEGQVGYGEDDNAEEVPLGYWDGEGLDGVSHKRELSYPPQFALVVGAESVATSSVDSWEWVLHINGEFHPLTDETIRKLTKDDEKDLVWLQHWLIAKPEHQRAANLEPRVATLLKQQAYQLVRLPLTEIDESASPEPFGPQPLGAPSGAAAPLTSEQNAEALFTDRRGILPGPYAHLLPIQAQGKIQAGRRVPIEVLTYSHGLQHVTHQQSPQHQKWAAARAALQAADDGIRSALDGLSPLDLAPPVSMFDRMTERHRGRGQTPDLVSGAGLEDVATILSQEDTLTATPILKEISQHLYHLRQIKALREDRADLADLYEEAVVAELKARDEIVAFTRGNVPPSQVKLWEAAKKILEFEDKLREQQDYRPAALGGENRNVVELSRDPRNSVLREQLKRQIGAIVRGIANDRIAREAEAAAGGGDGLRGQQLTFYVNEGRSVDDGARIYDADAGVVKLSRLPGWIEDPVLLRALAGPVKNVVPGRAGAIRFTPAPVRVTFGHELRPRIDTEYGAPPLEREQPRPVTGVDPALLPRAEPDKVRSAATDDLTFFTSYWRREPSGGASPIAPSLMSSPPLVLRRPDMVELIDVDGVSNRPALEQLSRQVAARRFAIREEISTRSHRFLGLWPVNPDGVVAKVTITTRKANGAAVMFETNVVTGGRRTLDAIHQGTRQRVRPAPVKNPDRATRGKGVSTK